MSDDLVKRRLRQPWPDRCRHTGERCDVDHCPCDIEEREAAAARIEVLEAALSNIVSPLAYLRAEAEAKGHRLSAQAYDIANSASFLQGIARDALASNQNFSTGTAPVTESAFPSLDQAQEMALRDQKADMSKNARAAARRAGVKVDPRVAAIKARAKEGGAP